MSRSPDPESIQQLRAKVSELNAVHALLSKAREQVKKVSELEVRVVHVGQEITALVKSMDCVEPRNMGFDGRMVQMLCEIIRQERSSG